MKDRSLVNKLMNAVVQGIFVAFPLSCASVAAYDVWTHGMHAVTTQFGLGIAGLILLAKAAVIGFRGVDFVLEESRHSRHDALALLSATRQRFADAIAPRLTPTPVS